jgi:hypothetical protein
LAALAYAQLVALPGFGFIFGLPVVRNVTQFIIDKIVAWAVQETSVGLSILWIQLDMQYEVSTAEQARVRLNDMLNNPTKYTEAEQAKISEAFDESTVDLIQLAIKRLA